MQLLRFHYRKLLIFAAVVCILFFLVLHIIDGGAASDMSMALLRAKLKGGEKTVNHISGSFRDTGLESSGEKLNIDMPVLAHRSPQGQMAAGKVGAYADLFQDIVQENSCPICFGSDLCEDITAGFLTLLTDIPQIQSNTSVYRARLGNLHELLVKVPSPQAFQQFFRGICASLGKGDDSVSCSPTVIERNSPLIAPADPLSAASIDGLRKGIGYPTSNIPLTMCGTPKLFSLLEMTYDENDDKNLSREEKAVLYSTLATAPDFAAHKLLTKFNLNVGFPRLVGICGRAGIIEGELAPLSSFLDQPFATRASLAAQLLTMVDDFMEDDPEWYLYQPEWALDQLYVNRDGDVVLLDLSRLTVVEKEILPAELEGTDNNLKELCNRECLQQFWDQVRDATLTAEERVKRCSQLGMVGQMMYANLCAMVLSDMDQHKYYDYFQNPAVLRRQRRTTRGLLHDAPSWEVASIEEHLAECVEETSLGGRLLAAQDLRDLLSDLLLDDEDENEDDADYYEDDEEEGYNADYDESKVVN